MSSECIGRVLLGSPDSIRAAYEDLLATPVDWDLTASPPAPVRPRQRTIAQPVSVSGPGTFHGKSSRTITLRPTDKPGWRFQRSDLPDCLPVRVSADTVWTTGDIVSNIVLRSGPPQNYIRMVEHIIAFRLGTDVDNVIVELDSGDPPLFKRGNLDLLEAFDRAGRAEADAPVRYVTVKERVAVEHPGGRMLIVEPADPKRPALTFDCGLHFPNAIGRQRIRFPLNDETVRMGAGARTNTPLSKMIFCKTLGKLFADVRNLGYTQENILIAGKRKYYNEPFLIHEGKSLEAVWHRAVLDLVAALALIEEGRFVGHVISHRAGHRLDVELVRLLVQNDLLVDVPV